MEAVFQEKPKVKSTSFTKKNEANNVVLDTKETAQISEKKPLEKNTNNDDKETKKISYVVSGPLYKSDKEKSDSNDNSESLNPEKKVTYANIQSLKGNHNTVVTQSNNDEKSTASGNNSFNNSDNNPITLSDSSVAKEVESIERTTPVDASNDVNFQQTIAKVKTTSKDKRAHTTVSKTEGQANEAARVPNGERTSRARGNQVAKIDNQKPGEFVAADFKAKLKAKINQMQLPKNEDQADDFESNNNIAQVNNAAKGDVVVAKKKVTGTIEAATKQEPNEQLVAQRTAKALPDPKIGNKAIINISKALPPKRGNSEINAPLQKQYNTVEQDMKQNQITDEQLSKSNEPSFSSALSAKNEAKQNAQAAPEKFRTEEKNTLAVAKTEAQNKTNLNVEAMHTSRKGLLNGVVDQQKKAGSTNTTKNEEAVAKLNEIYTNTKKIVDEQLGSLEETVTTIFDRGAEAAKAAFEKHVAQKMSAYKKKRYGKWYDVRGYGKRIGDAWNGLPKEVEAFFVTGRQVFLDTLDTYITQISTIVASRLNTAKAQIATGRKELSKHIKGLPADIKRAIKGDIDTIQGKFNELEETVNQKEADLIDTLATKYKEALEQVDARIEEMKAANEGLLGMAKRALLAVIEVINNIRKTIAEILSAAADIIMAIIADPIGFLSNLISGVSDGFTNFGTNILKHLQAGLMGWLTGAMDGMDIKMPEDVFSLKGIFSLSSQILGFTWDKIRMVGAKVVGEPVVKALETGFELITILRNDGIAGLWEHIKEQFTDLKETVMDAITDMIQSQVVQAGIKWIMGLLTPAGAFIKAAMAIIDIVKFFVQRAAQIMELVQAFIEGVKAVASGSVKAVSSAIENALAKAVPVVIGFLAALLGLGGLTQKVIGIFKKIHARVEKGLIALWTKLKTMGASLLSKITGKDKGKDKAIKDERTVAQKQKDLESGIKEGTQYLRTEKQLSKKIIDDKLDEISNKHQLVDLKLVIDKHEETGKDLVHIHGKVNPEKEGDKIEVQLEGIGVEINLNDRIEKAIISENEMQIQIQKLLDAGVKSALFRGDNNYNGGDIGLELNSEEAKSAKIQDPYTHVQDNDKGESTIYSSFSIRMVMPNGNGPQKFARKDKIFKIEFSTLLELIKEGTIKIYTPQDIKDYIKNHPEKKIRRFANAVYDAMFKHGEILIEGQIPSKYITKTK